MYAGGGKRARKDTHKQHGTAITTTAKSKQRLNIYRSNTPGYFRRAHHTHLNKKGAKRTQLMAFISGALRSTKPTSLERCGSAASRSSCSSFRLFCAISVGSACDSLLSSAATCGG